MIHSECTCIPYLSWWYHIDYVMLLFTISIFTNRCGIYAHTFIYIYIYIIYIYIYVYLNMCVIVCVSSWAHAPVHAFVRVFRYGKDG